MKYTQLGKNGPKVSAMGLGCMGMSGIYGAPDEKAGSKVIQLAYEKGINFFDTADMYGDGANEKLLGASVKTFRQHVVIATKCGIDVSNNGMKFNNDPSYIKKACHGSLKRLGLETIDLYYLHRYNPQVPLETSMQAMLDLIREGKILYVGLCEVDGAVIEKAHQILGDKLVALQSEYSIINHSAAEVALPTCRNLGLSFVAFSPIARGLLSGKVRDSKKFKESKEFDFRSEHPQFQGDAYGNNLKLVDAIEALAKKKNCTCAQLSLAWLMAQGKDIIPIPGTRRTEYLIENIKALEVHLTKAELEAIDKVIKEHPIQGNRYPDEIMKISYLKF